MRHGVDLDDQGHALVHGDGQRLRAAHLAQAGGQHELALERGPALLAGQAAEGLVGALEDALGADVDPGAGGHLAVHDQALLLPAVEVLLGGPVGHDVAVGDQHARRVLVGAEDGDRLAALHQQRLVGFQVFEGAQDGVEALPVAGRLAAAAVDDQVVGVEGHLRVQVVLQHAVGGLDQPVLAGQLRAARRADGAGHGGLLGGELGGTRELSGTRNNRLRWRSFGSVCRNVACHSSAKRMHAQRTKGRGVRRRSEVSAV